MLGFPRLPRASGPITVFSVGDFWRRIRSEIGLHDVRLHDLRHSYASIAVMAGENILTVGRLLGHNDPGTTLKYTHLSDDTAVEAAEALGPILASAAS